ncbi:cytidylyltransferase domain-containing protein [Bacillus sp. FJAT-42315]|uniref:cytidylyltransferase domain-containing protein n=1 Tax=Bacillus sp. FJAT-42315 TaxID=2014077 RepID=UPI000C24B75E|nr:glycosyltransferase family protein [Bacillus sp. FJAT-42315]
MKTVAIIQARMGSTRLPGKVLKKIMDKTLLEYQIERVNKCFLIDDIVVATTVKEEDTVIEDLCNKIGVKVYRGHEEDVLSRYYEAAERFRADVIVRLTSDCPLIDPRIVDEVIQAYFKQYNSVDYVSNTFERTFPRGLDTEVFSFDSLKKAHSEAVLPSEREHVTSYFYNNSHQFRMGNVRSKRDYSNYRWTVDTVEDFELIQLVLKELYKPDDTFYLKDVVQLLEMNPKWNDINSHIEQKKF